MLPFPIGNPQEINAKKHHGGTKKHFSRGAIHHPYKSWVFSVSMRAFFHLHTVEGTGGEEVLTELFSKDIVNLAGHHYRQPCKHRQTEELGPPSV